LVLEKYKFISVEGKEFESYSHYVINELNKDYDIEFGKLEPGIPEYYLSEIRNEEIEKKLFDCRVSKNSIKYKSILEDFKNIPFFPKFCTVNEESYILWINPKKIVV
jgi:hypothetical protein